MSGNTPETRCKLALSTDGGKTKLSLREPVGYIALWNFFKKLHLLVLLNSVRILHFILIPFNKFDSQFQLSIHDTLRNIFIFILFYNFTFIFKAADFFFILTFFLCQKAPQELDAFVLKRKISPDYSSNLIV